MSIKSKILNCLKVQLELSTITPEDYNLLFGLACIENISTSTWQALVNINYIDRKDPRYNQSYNKYRKEYQPTNQLRDITKL